MGLMNWTNGEFAGTGSLGVLKTSLMYFEMLHPGSEVWWKAIIVLYIFLRCGETFLSCFRKKSI